MSSDPQPTGPKAADELRDVLARVRRIDPSCDSDAVGRYLQEIRAADAVLGEIALRDSTPVAGFAPCWPRERAK